MKTTNPLKQIETLEYFSGTSLLLEILKKLTSSELPARTKTSQQSVSRERHHWNDRFWATAVTPRASKHQGSISTSPMAACIASCGGDDTWQSLDWESSWLHHETTSCSNANTYQHVTPSSSHSTPGCPGR